jgi:hypothetical protein
MIIANYVKVVSQGWSCKYFLISALRRSCEELWMQEAFPCDTLTIGSKSAWVFEDSDAKAGFRSFAATAWAALSALERDERVMAVLGSRILENRNRMAETTTAIMLRQAGENSVLANSTPLRYSVLPLHPWQTGPVSKTQAT